MFEENNGQNFFDNNIETIGTKIKIIGVGGAGGNVLNDMIESQIHGVKYVAINTDEQDLKKSKAEEKISLGHLGAGANPEIARIAAEQKKLEIQRIIQGQDMVFITAGMGGGTGTGAAPIVAEVAKNEGILTVAIVTKPYKVEGKKRENNANMGIEELKKHVDTLIVIPNDKLLELPGAGEKSFYEHLKASNNILRFGVKGISELITKEGNINLDFSDVKAIMENSGVALFGFAESEPDEELTSLVEKAISNPLLEKDIKGATKILVNITAGNRLTMNAVHEIQTLISKKASGSESGVENLIFGSIYEPERDNIILSVIATGFNTEDDDEDKISNDSYDGKIFSDNKDLEFVPTFG